MTKNQIDELVHQTISYYNDYGLHIAAKIHNLTAFELTQTIEEKYPVDTITLSDGTRIWNLLRIYIYSNLPELLRKNKNQTPHLSPFHFLKESITPLSIPPVSNPVWGFSGGASRKFFKDTYYDIYFDSLSQILGDRLVLFEWPESRGSHRAYGDKLYSKHYVPFHIPMYTSTFWELFFYRLTGRRPFSIENEKILNEIIEFISSVSNGDKEEIIKDIYDFIAIFFSLKKFFSKILKKVSPKAVLIRCGYGRFPMALSQACHECSIPTIELQHGLITSNHSAYIKTTMSENRDCIPDYLLTYGDTFTEMVRNGNLFDKNKIISIGFPYLERNQNALQKSNIVFKNLISTFEHTILITAQEIISNEIQKFILEVAEKFNQSRLKIGIVFKPHPLDNTDYSSLKNHNNILLIDKYEDIYDILKSVDIHSTVYSTSGLEAMAFGKPSIFIDIFGITNITNSPFIVTTPTQFVETVKYILSKYDELSQKTLEAAEIFFKSSSEKNIKKFFTESHLL